MGRRAVCPGRHLLGEMKPSVSATRALALLMAAGLVSMTACGDDDDGDTSFIHLQCPGGEGCPDQGDGVLWVGVSVVDLTPLDLKEGPSFVDNNGDGEFNPRDGDTFTDANGDGKLDAVWIAGFGSSRPAVGVHDPLEGRILVLRQNETTVVWIAVDFVGFFFDYLEEVRARLEPSIAAQVDLVMISATHTHQGPDTIGIWGKSLTESGLDLDYLDWVFGQLAGGIGEAVSSLEEAHVTFGSILVEDPDGSTDAYMNDGRDPNIMDQTMQVMRLHRPGTDQTIASVVGFASHPEFVGDRNNLLSADYPYFLREAVESGDSTGIQGIGGVCLFVSGALGGQIGPKHVTPLDRDGVPQPSSGFAKAQAVGESYAEFALAALRPENGAVTVERPELFFRTRRVYASIDNTLYQAAWRLGIFNRSLYNFVPDSAITEENTPQILTELVYMRLGSASFASAPGELHPELFVGCYDGTCSGLRPLIRPDNPNPPNLSLAPEGPYLRDLLAADGSQFQWLLGLTQDELGYLMPDYNFILDPDVPYLSEAEGHHYEETNSLGPRAHRELVVPLEELILWP